MPALSDGLHHATAMAGRAQANIEFYVRFMGLRLVKRTVNFDDPQTYHFYFGDALGNPGSLITFFPWPGAGPAVRGRSEPVAVRFRVPPGALPAWRERLTEAGLEHSDGETFGRELVAFADPDGTPLELVEGEAAPAPAVTPKAGAPEAGGQLQDDRVALDTILTPTRYWTGSSVPPEEAISGLDSCTLNTGSIEASAELLGKVVGWLPDPAAPGEEKGRLRLLPPDVDPKVATAVELVSTGPEGSGRLGTGSIHHVAFRVADDEALARGRELILQAGAMPTKAKNRVYFRSIYFRDPSGVILELATDTPGFTVDEPADELGLAFKLPDWLEPDRQEIRANLPVTASPEYADRFR